MEIINIWLSIFIIGLIFYPITSLIFKKFNDKGWLFSKVIGICTSGWIMWFISSLKILRYNTLNSYLVIILFLIINFIVLIFRFNKDKFKVKNTFSFIKKGLNNFIHSFDKKLIKNIIVSELLFIICFSFWTYIKGFNPAINNSTEQFMDYGYLNSIMQSEYMPPQDIWLSNTSINYYYFGQYISGFICKISNINASVGYNYIIAFIATCTFTLPFSLGYNLFKDKLTKKKGKVLLIIISIAIGLSNSIGGSLHYPIYRWFNPISEEYSYIDETRYIGYKPEVPDKTATEVPAYSTIVGDLHAHYIDLAFSLVMIGLLATYFLNKKEDTDTELKTTHLSLISLFLGICRMTNYWDFPIYIVILSAMIVAKKLICDKCDKKSIINTILTILKIILLEEIITLPFTRNLYIGSTEVAFTGIMSPFYKLLVKWGLPTLCAIVFLVLFLRNYHKNNKTTFANYLNDNLADLFVIILSLCAMGLVLLPEIIYLKDIYGSDYKRFNTMFKLTYQAYLLFSICTSYFLGKIILNKKKILKTLAIILLLINSTTFIYGIDTIITNYKNKEHLGISADSTESFIKKTLPNDYEAIKWIRENISKDKIILESTEYGNSYTTSSRISTFTGNPTVLGWSYHEWVWRANASHSLPVEVTTRNSDVHTIYTSTNKEEIIKLINLYNIDYIYIGELENQKYDNLDIKFYQSFGNIVYENNKNYLIQVNKNLGN